MRQTSNPVYPLDEAIEILTEKAPEHIYILTTSLEETKTIIKLAKALNYQSASTVWVNVLELLKRGRA